MAKRLTKMIIKLCALWPKIFAKITRKIPKVLKKASQLAEEAYEILPNYDNLYFIAVPLLMG